MSRIGISAAAGWFGVLLLVGVQAVSEHRGPPALRLPPGRNADTGPGPGRRAAVLDGKLQVAPHELPVLGSADAPKLLVVLFDYCCPHCRGTHEDLTEALRRYRGQLAVVALPMPLDADCNPAVEETEERFRNACELARLALAVWRADPAAFPAYDVWLFEPTQPREVAEAERKAAELVGAASLKAALADPWIEERIKEHVTAYAGSGVERIPILMSPGFATVVGRPESREALFGILENELGLKAVEASRTESADAGSVR